MEEENDTSESAFIGEPIRIRIRSWYPGWLTGLVVRYAIWKYTRGHK